jgi:hypothetical protein
MRGRVMALLGLASQVRRLPIASIVFIVFRPDLLAVYKTAAPTNTLFCPNDTMTEGSSSMSMSIDSDGSSQFMNSTGMASDMPSPSCIVQSWPFLQTVAYCIDTHCNDIADRNISTLEAYWKNNMAGRQANQPLPTLTYQDALRGIPSPPNETLNKGSTMQHAVLIPYEDWLEDYNCDVQFEYQESVSELYGLVLFVTGAAVPMFLSLLRLLPFSARWTSRFNAYFVDPPVFGKHHTVPVLGLAIVPTRGQAFFIFYLIVINTVLSAVSFYSRQPFSWLPYHSIEIADYVTNRLGLLSFANIALCILFAGRNTILIWLTNWSHSTFLLLHLWAAFIATLQAALHSAIYLQMYLNNAGYDYGAEVVLPYWIWGIVGTMALVILLPLSLPLVRKRMYEAFLASHIVLSIFVIMGCWYHIVACFQRQWGYENWMIIAAVIWAFDRVLRVARTAKNGIKRAHLTILDAEYLRVDVAGLNVSGHMYAYFPTLTWRVWENHPFSVAGMTCSSKASDQVALPGEKEQRLGERSPTGGEAKDPSAVSASSTPSVSSSRRVYASSPATFFLRAQAGLTRQLLRKATDHPHGIPVFVGSSYSGPSSAGGPRIISSSHDNVLHDNPNLLCIAGGVGITALLAVLNDTQALTRHGGRRNLYWTVRSQALVDGVRELVSSALEHGSHERRAKELWGDVDVHIFLGERMSVRSVLEAELTGQSGTTVVVSGPALLGRRGAMHRDRVSSWCCRRPGCYGQTGCGELQLVD